MEYDQDTRYRFNRFAMNYIATANVMNFFEEHQCFWLGDVIASYKPTLIKKNADYLKVVQVNLNETGGCTFTIGDEINGQLVKQDIPFTDLKENVTFWLISEGENEVLIFPEDY
jgi:hypothetical protein